MPISFVPSPNDVLMCEYGPNPNDPITFCVDPSIPIACEYSRDRHQNNQLTISPGVAYGPLSVSPEMWKRRHVVIISTSYNTSIVVPLSTDVPTVPRGYHYRIPAGTYPFLDRSRDSWVKADMMGAVSHRRLDRVLINGRYSRASLTTNDFKEVKKCVLDAMNMKHLTPHL